MTKARAYRSIFRIQLAEGLQYRASALSGALVSFFWAFIEIAVYTIFFTYADADHAGAASAGISLSQTVSYIWLGQFLFLMQPVYLSGDLVGKIKSGDVGLELCRPLDLYGHWFAKTSAERLAPLVWRGIPVLLAGFFLPVSGFRLGLPASVPGFFAALASLGGAFLLCSAYGMFVLAFRMNVDWGEGPAQILMLVPSVLSGTYLPLQLWPEALQHFLFLQPFSGYMDLPGRLYVGTLAPGNAVWAVGLQIFWSILFLLAGRARLTRRIRSIVVQGG